MPPDGCLVRSQIDAKGLVVCHVTFDPLNVVRPNLAQSLVRFRRSIRQLLGIEAANLGDVPLDNEFSKCHGWPFAPLLPG